MTAFDKIKASGIAGGFAGAMGGLLRKCNSRAQKPLYQGDPNCAQGETETSYPALLCGPCLVQAVKPSAVPC
jgi:hypothetical protein